MGWRRKWRKSTPPEYKLARQATAHLKEKQAGDAWVGGSIGPLGVRLEPLGKTGLDEARAAFAEQIRALADAGADLLDDRDHAGAE